MSGEYSITCPVVPIGPICEHTAVNGENQEAQSGLRIIGVGIAIGLVLFMGSVGYAKWHAQPSRHLEPLLFILNVAPYIGVAIILLLGIAKAVLERLASKNNGDGASQGKGKRLTITFIYPYPN